MTPPLTQEVAEHRLKLVLDSFSDEQRQMLVYNLNAGKTLLCGPRAYLFTDGNAGDMITLSMTNDLPADKFDFARIRLIDQASCDRYQEILNKHGLEYYFATQSIDELSFKNLILTHLEQSQ